MVLCSADLRIRKFGSCRPGGRPRRGADGLRFQLLGRWQQRHVVGEDKLSIHVGVSLMEFKLHAGDCCVPGDEWKLVIDGMDVGWDVEQSGDGNPNGGAFLRTSNPGSGYFEALTTIVLAAGDHTIDMTQIAGIAGGSYFNMSSGKSLPVPGTLLLVGAALVALGVKRQRLA